MTLAGANLNARYELKGGKYSSHSLLLAHFPEPGNGKRVLDVGCAEGFFADLLAQRGYSVLGVDFPGTRHPDTIEFHGANLDNGLDGVPGGFDLVVCADVLEHVRDPLRLLLECRDRLKPEGSLIASLPNSGHWYFRGNILIGRFPQDPKGLFDATHVRFYMWDGWVELFRSAGFRIASAQSSTVPFGLALPRWDGTWLVSLLERLSCECARVWKRLFAYQFVVVARPEALT
jgi:SAM-dependent methyltransferase